MAIEQYANLCSTNLTAGYTPGAGSIQVTSTGSPFPSSPQFHVYIADVTTGIVKVILKVTAVTDGTHWAVTAEGNDVSANANDVVKLSLTAGAIDQMRADNVALSTFASKNTAAKAGRIQLYSDVPNLARDNGSSFDPFGPVYPLGDVTSPSFSWRNQGSATLSNNGQTSFLLVAALAAGHDLKCREITAPGTPYSISVAFVPQFLQTSANIGFGLYFADSSSGKIVIGGLVNVGTNNVNLRVDNFTNATTFSGNVGVLGSIQTITTPIWIKAQDTGTDHVFSWSVNGVNFQQIFSVGRTAFLTTPDRVGFFGDSGGSNLAFGLSILSWVQGV